MYRLKLVFNFLSSMRFGLGLFVAAAAVSALGSIVPALGDAVYGSWWFAAILLALVLNTGLCTYRQLPRLLHGAARTRVLFAVHASVLVLSLACVWAAITFTTDSVVVEEGGSFQVGGAEWRLEKVEVLYYPDGSVSDWVSTVATPEGRQEIRVNHPAGGGAEKVLQSAYSRIYRARLEAAGTSREIELEQDTEFPLTADGSVGFALSPPLAGSLAAGRDAGMPGMVDLLLTARGRIVQRAAMFEGLPLDIGETGLRLTVTGSRARSGFLVRHTPGLPFVWAGFALLGLSVTALMLLPRRPAQLAHKEKADA